MCESLWFPNSVSLSCSTFTIRGCLTVNKYNTSGEIINTNLSEFISKFSVWETLQKLDLPKNILLLSSIPDLLHTSNDYHVWHSLKASSPPPELQRPHHPQYMSMTRNDEHWRRPQQTEEPGEESISWSVCGGQWWHDRTMGQLWGCQWLQSAIISETDSKCCP